VSNATWSRDPQEKQPPQPPRRDPHLEAVIGQLEAVVKEREGKINALTKQRREKVEELTAEVDRAEAGVGNLGRLAEAATSTAALLRQKAAQAVLDAETSAAEMLDAARAAAAEGRRLAAAKHAQVSQEAAGYDQEAADLEAAIREQRDVLKGLQRQLATASGPYDEQIEKLRKGRYLEALKRLPELRERLERRNQQQREWDEARLRETEEALARLAATEKAP